jgi:predicted SprT family Zn-dependent metalloprotease
MRPPAWAQQLLEQVAATHAIGVPRLSWKEAEGSSGRYYRRGEGRINIVAGSDDEETRMVVLHEMAHHLAHVLGRAEKGHGEAFYFICWALYLAYEVPLDLAVAREFQYKASAERTLLKMGIKLDARARKAGAYGDTCRELHGLQASERKWRLRAKESRGGNLNFYLQKANEAAARAAKVASSSRRLEAEWKMSV